MNQTEFQIDVLPYALIPKEKWQKASEEAKQCSESDPDDIIDAYQTGVDKGMNTTHQLLLKSFQENLDKAFFISEGFLKEMNTNMHIGVNDLFIKVNSLSSFDALYVINLDNYLSEIRKEIYKKAREIKKEKKEDLFNINFSFMPNTGTINGSGLTSEGFIFKYAVKTRQA